LSAPIVGVTLAVWLGLVVLAGSAGRFVTQAGQPPLALLIAVVLPVGLYAAAYVSSGGFREFVRAGDPVFVTTLQSWRVLGGSFLVLLSLGLLPATFAVPAGLGDFAIGVTAPFVARAMAERGPVRAWPLFAAWQWLGVLDLVIAVGIGASLRTFPGLAGDPSTVERMVLMAQLPLSLVPAFAVPLFVILHLASLAQARARRGAGL
jgi:hypothetical protein